MKEIADSGRIIKNMEKYVRHIYARTSITKEGKSMSTTTYLCPACGASVAYDGESGKLKCASCGNLYDMDALEDISHSEEGGGIQFEMPEASYGEEEASQMQAYTCSGCGAELLTEGTTTATECPYCGSPAILPEQIEGGVKPEKVLPFIVTKEEAQKKFEEYFKGKALLPNIFLNTRNRITEMRKLYVPYWLFDCEADATILYDAQKHRTERDGEWEIEHIRHYAVRRSGQMGFENIPVDGSVKMDNKITESLEPYDLSAAVDFQPAVLAGALADRADVDAEECQARAVERVETSMASALRETVQGYTVVMERSRSFRSEGGKVTPVLMPVWVITTEKDGKTYTFAINGQTGKLTCDVPADTKKSLLWGGGVFAGVMGIAVLILYLMQSLESGTLLIAALIALIAAFATVGGLRAQLKQAVSQSGASSYVRPGSFRLNAHFDRFLYETTNRRRIETQQKN